MDNNNLATAPIGKLLLKYSIPGIIGMMVTSLYNVVDRIFIGHIADIGAIAIDGVGATMPVTTIILAFGMLVGMGATSNISLSLGRGDKENAEHILGNALILSLVFSVLLTVAGLLLCTPMLLLFGASETTLPYANEYMVIILLGTIFNNTCFSINNTIRADGSPVTAGATMLLGCILNVILDPIFIFVFGWGVAGAAVATVISQMVSCVWVLFYYFGGKSNLKITQKTLKLQMKYIIMILSIGVSPFAMQIMISISSAILNNKLKFFGGDHAVGAYTIINSVVMLFLMAIFGLNQGGQPIISYNYGAQNYDRVKKTLKTVLIIGTAYLLLGFFITQVFPEFFITLFNKDAELVQMTVEGMKINLFAMPVLAMCVMGSTFFQFIGKPKISLVLSLLRQCLLLIPVLLILPEFLGLNGVWMAQPICDAISAVIITVCVFVENRRH